MSKPDTDIVSNPKARRDYQIGDTYECGLVLTGTEVKSIRAGKAQISEAFARVEKGEVWLYNSHIEEYTHGNRMNHEPRAKRKLLLKKPEIRKLFDEASIKGNSLVPLKLYWKQSKVKVLLGVGKGKAKGDKRQDMQKRDSDREMKRAMMAAMKGR